MNVCIHCVRDITHSNPSLNPLILPLGAQLSVNKGRESKERERRSGLSSLSSWIRGRSASHLHNIIHLRCIIPQKLIDLNTTAVASLWHTPVS